MPETMLQKYLNNQFIKTSEEATIASLRKAVTAVVKLLEKKKSKVIPYTLVAIDPQISENDPVVEEVEKIIVSKWKTFKNSVSKTKDKSTNYIRAVILQALSQLAKEEEYAAIIWHTSRDIISFYKTGKEADVLSEFLQRMGDEVELKGQHYWGVGSNPEITQFEGTEINLEVGKAAEVSEGNMIGHFLAAAVHSAWAGQAGGGENPQMPITRNVTWSKFFAERAGHGVTTEINRVLSSQTKSLNEISDNLQRELDTYFEQLQPFFEEISTTIANGVVANNKRSELLWWKQSLYSPNIRATYRKMDAVSAAIAMTVDLSDLVNPVYPVSVDFLLKETLRDVFGDEIVNSEKELANLIAEIEKMDEQFKGLLTSLSDEDEGRKSLGSALANLVTTESTADIFSETGIDKKAKLSLADLLVWLFHDLQAVKLSRIK